MLLTPLQGAQAGSENGSAEGGMGGVSSIRNMVGARHNCSF